MTRRNESLFVRRQSSRRAFALVVALLLLAMLLPLALVSVAFIALQSKFVEHQNNAYAGLQLARSCADIAAGRVALLTGKDSVITVEEFYGNDEVQPWLYAIDKNNKKTALVSNDGIFEDDGDYEFLDLPNGKCAKVPWQYSAEGKFRFAAIVIDEGNRPTLAAFPPKTFVENADENLQQLYLTKDYSKWFAGTDFGEEFENHLGKFAYWGLFNKLTDGSKTILDFTGLNYTVLADWPRERLKEDLSNPLYEREILGESLAKNETFFKVPDDGLSIAKTQGETSGEFGFCDRIFPFPLDTKLHIVFFNARSDGQHRAKFYTTTTFWNPYAFPLNAQNKGYFALTDFPEMPQVLLENLNTGVTWQWGLADFPIGKFGNAKQTASDKTFNAYNYIFDTGTPGLNAKTDGFHMGEIYVARWPDPETQPQGLSRITGMPTWKLSTNKNSEKPPSGIAGEGRWFHKEHRIRISSVPDSGNVTFMLRAYVGTLKSSITTSEYSVPLVEFKNIPFPQFSIEMSGEDYNRQTANVNTVDECQIVLQIRLKIEDEAAMNAFLAKHDFRDLTFDFSLPEVSAAFDVKILTGDDAKNAATATSSPEQAPIFDEKMNSHDTNFACFPFFDLPNCEPISAGTLRHFYWSKLPFSAMGTNSGSENVNKIYDKYFFSGLDYGNDKSRGNAELDIDAEYYKNPFLRRGKLKDKKTDDPASSLYIIGAINVNSTNSALWESVLRNAFANWKHRSRRSSDAKITWDDSPEKSLKNVFFTRPFSAQASLPNKNNEILTDEELEKLSGLKFSTQLISQGSRQIPDEKIKLLAQKIAAEISKKQDAGTYFHSIEDFVKSGVLQTAIDTAGINNFNGKSVPAWLPNYISQRTLLDLLAPILAPRSDTFKIIVKAQALNDLTGVVKSTHMAEIIIQRTAEPHDSEELFNTLGRKFKVVNFRWIY